MLKLTKTAVGLLTKQYRSVLRKCLLLNLGLFVLPPMMGVIPNNVYASIIISDDCGGTSADGLYGVAIGCNAIAKNQGGIALGYQASTGNTDVMAAWETALGSFAHAEGTYSTAVGHRAYVYGTESITLGNHAVARANSSVVLGSHSTASEDNVVSVGHLSTDLNWGGSAFGGDLFRRIVNVAEGTGAHDAVTVSQLGNIAAGTKILNANSGSAITFGTESGQTTVGIAISTLANQLYNYYYTFRVDERTEVIEFANDLRSNKKEMSSLDFMPIKSSSDLRINLIKAEDPLTFSAKTRDDSLGLMEVCHA